jgi:hypothetical protein
MSFECVLSFLTANTDKISSRVAKRNNNQWDETRPTSTASDPAASSKYSVCFLRAQAAQQSQQHMHPLSVVYGYLINARSSPFVVNLRQQIAMREAPSGNSPSIGGSSRVDKQIKPTRFPRISWGDGPGFSDIGKEHNESFSDSLQPTKPTSYTSDATQRSVI